MITGIDHVVVAVEDLDQAIKTYEQLGFTVVPGGRHDSCTHNALIGFADGSYIELLAFYEDCENHVWWEAAKMTYPMHGSIITGHILKGGLVDICMRTDDIEADFAAFQRAGVQMSPLERMSRTRPDGYELSWTNNKVLGDHQGLIPFLIQDHTPREERVPSQPEMVRHKNGVTQMSVISFSCWDVTDIVVIWAKSDVLDDSDPYGGLSGPEEVPDERSIYAWVSFPEKRHQLSYSEPLYRTLGGEIMRMRHKMSPNRLFALSLLTNKRSAEADISPLDAESVTIYITL